jgi:adenylosuccinate lyase
MPESNKKSDISLLALSPLDGRYVSKIRVLSDYFSEFALIKYRVKVEIEYLIALFEFGPITGDLDEQAKKNLRGIFENFDLQNANSIKEKEKEINHDVKAVEYFIKDSLEELGLDKLKEWVHFGLTSQDINNTAYPIMISEALKRVILPKLDEVLNEFGDISSKWKHISMLARTHGQAASPTDLGKEIGVFKYRMQKQRDVLEKIPNSGKFGGATGNFNAHHVAFPDFDWVAFGNRFLAEIGLVRQELTTQIENYDTMAAMFHCMVRINTILIDFCRDIWHYISINYISQKSLKNEVGSSAMPHKVNPIDFENAEGNLGIANSLFYHLSRDLPISRLQRDLTDSTVLRNTGTPFGHSLISYDSILKGLAKLEPNKTEIDRDLEKNWIVISEGIQSILRREGYNNPYETLKDLTRGKSQITREEIHEFIEGLNVENNIKEELKRITPQNYAGIVPDQ